jgi:hypothetical protein
MDRLIVAWHEVPLARSAWDSATRMTRPVGYGVIRAGVRADPMIGVTKHGGAHFDQKFLWD